MKSEIVNGVLLKVDVADLVDGHFFCDKVTSVAKDAFLGCMGVITVDLPQVTTIEVRAFASCFDLTTVSLPQLTTLAESAFFGCFKLANVYLPLATTIEKDALKNGLGLITITLSEQVSIAQGNDFRSVKLVIIDNSKNQTSLDSIRKNLPKNLKNKEIRLKDDEITKLLHSNKILTNNLPFDLISKVVEFRSELGFFNNKKDSVPGNTGFKELPGCISAYF